MANATKTEFMVYPGTYGPLFVGADEADSPKKAAEVARQKLRLPNESMPVKVEVFVNGQLAKDVQETIEVTNG